MVDNEAKLAQRQKQPISQRAQIILKYLVESYIKDGQPVGSKTIATEALPSLSPATIRKVLSDLENMGYLQSPHTSAGRIPTAQGLRVFVDSLLTVHPLASKKANEVKAHLNPFQSTEDLITTTSSVLSEVTQLMGIVTLPKREKLVLRHAEFLPLSDNRVLVILVVNEKEVQNRIIEMPHNYSAGELRQAGNFLTTHFAGKDLSLVRNELLTALEKDRLHMDSMMKAVVDLAGKALNTEPNPEDYVLSGQPNLIEKSNLGDIPKIQRLFFEFTEKQRLLYLLDNCLAAEGVQMFIGEESGYEPLKHCTLVTSRYIVEGEVVGVLGVIGPTRMHYDKVIPIVDLTAKLLGLALNQN